LLDVAQIVVDRSNELIEIKHYSGCLKVASDSEASLRISVDIYRLISSDCKVLFIFKCGLEQLFYCSEVDEDAMRMCVPKVVWDDSRDLETFIAVDVNSETIGINDG
jgi:hypothetical protein